MAERPVLTAADVIAFAEDLVAVLEVAQPRLDALDAQGGDADHGTTMVLAARAARGAVAGRPSGASAGRCFALLGDGFASVGGSVGPLWAAAWYAIADIVDRGRESGLVAPGLESIVDAVGSLGSASEGDGTMLDALAPAARSAKVPGTSSAVVAKAAQEGAASTAGRPARVGRAARSNTIRSSEDPGAASAVLVLGLLVPLLGTGKTGIAK